MAKTVVLCFIFSRWQTVLSFHFSSTVSISDDTESNAGNKEGIFKYDMGWQKRGSGRSYDSKSGNNTGKMCAFGVR